MPSRRRAGRRPAALAASAALALLLLAPAPALLAQAAAPAPEPEGLAGTLQGILDAKTSSGELVGAVFVARRGGETVFEGASGLMDREAGIPMRMDALFRLASVSKAFTSAAAAAMFSRGGISLDDPVTRHLPGFAPTMPDGSPAVITLRHLLTHTSGLGYGFEETAGGPLHRAGVSDGCSRDEGLTLDENMRRLASVPLLFAPGTSWRYSLSADVMGAVMAAAAGKPLPTVMGELVTGPLDLPDTDYYARDPSRLAVPYADSGGRIHRMADPENYPLGGGRTFIYSPGRALDPGAWPSGGCGMVSSARDVSILVDAVARSGEGFADPKVMEWFLSDAAAPLDSGADEGFGGGWSYLKAPVHGPWSPGTVTWSGVYGNRWFADPASGISAALLTNTALAGMSGNTMDLLAEALYSAR
ncbi:MAG: beta-lactamase family protein [Deltaproteobacteria bacterium]|jgi:CubicO group peptidase (beta-lactamase class C family)|nr:beta-lactamase family protein [Deltaproteobacteria bacterium]